MANSAQARKRARQAETRRQQNMGLRSEMRTAVKKVRKAIAAGDKAAAQTVFREAQSVIDSVVGRGIFHRNLGARSKSRLSDAIKAMA
jgi:small subunit ribosomal protein S20